MIQNYKVIGTWRTDLYYDFRLSMYAIIMKNIHKIIENIYRKKQHLYIQPTGKCVLVMLKKNNMATIVNHGNYKLTRVRLRKP